MSIKKFNRLLVYWIDGEYNSVFGDIENAIEEYTQVVRLAEGMIKKEKNKEISNKLKFYKDLAMEKRRKLVCTAKFGSQMNTDLMSYSSPYNSTSTGSLNFGSQMNTDLISYSTPLRFGTQNLMSYSTPLSTNEDSSSLKFGSQMNTDLMSYSTPFK